MIAIIKRARELNLKLTGDHITQILDLEHAYDQFNLKLSDLLTSNNQDFAHDFIGIQRHMNRESGIVENCFVPRYAG
jgi:hypothetical protein